MTELLVLAAIAGIIWIALLFLRVPSSIAFFSLLVGQLLATEAGADVYDFVGSLLRIPELRYIQITLLLLPLLLTILFLRGSVSKAKLLIEIVPCLFVALVVLLLLYPLIPELQNAANNATGRKIEDLKGVIIIAASVSGLISAWASYPRHHSGKHGKHGKH